VAHPRPPAAQRPPRTIIPLLQAQHEPGELLLACAVLGQPGTQDDAWEQPPILTDWLARD